MSPPNVQYGPVRAVGPAAVGPAFRVAGVVGGPDLGRFVTESLDSVEAVHADGQPLDAAGG